MFKIATAAASGSSGSEAVLNAWVDIENTIGDRPIIGAIMFSSSTFDQTEVASTLQGKLGADIPFVGASTAGEISKSGPSVAPSVTVMVFSSDTIGCHSALVTDVSGNEEAKGTELGNLLSGQTDKKIEYCTIHADGLKVNPNGILKGLSAALPDAVLTGGSAGDDGNYKQTYQYYNGETHSNAVAALAFSGPISVSVGVRHGWNPISGIRTVTKAEGQVVHTIDDKPAISLYEEFLGEEVAEQLKEVTLAKVALSYPVGIVTPDSNTMLLRAPFYVDAEGSITFGGEVPEGSSIQLMIGSKEEAVEAAAVAAADAVEQLGTTPSGALIYSCHIRDTLYATREESKLEIEAIQRAVGSETPMAGFYTYAEQAPVRDKAVDIKTCDPATHNETVVTVLFSETT